jgi:hypothetical protein
MPATLTEDKALQNRLRVRAAGSLPFVGDIAAAGTAARVAPRDKPRAFGQTLAQQYGSAVGGTIVGGRIGYGLTQLHPRVATGAAHTVAQVGRTKAAVRAKIPVKIVSTKPPGPVLRAAKQVPKAISHAGKLATPGGMIGGLVGGAIAGQTVAPALYARYQRKHEMESASKSLRDTKRDVVSKRDVSTMSLDERKKLAREKRRQAHLAYVGGSLGITGLGLLGASRFAKPATRAKLLRAATITPVVGGGVGAVGAFNLGRIQNREASQIYPQQKVKKDWHNRRYRHLADEDYQYSTGMPRVHRGTYPSAKFMAQHGVGVKGGKVYVGHQRLTEPVNPQKAQRASEHAKKQSQHEAKARVLSHADEVVGGLTGVGALKTLSHYGGYPKAREVVRAARSGHLRELRGRHLKALKYAIPLTAATAIPATIGSRVFLKPYLADERRRAGRSRYYGSQALIEAAGFPIAKPNQQKKAEVAKSYRMSTMPRLRYRPRNVRRMSAGGTAYRRLSSGVTTAYTFRGSVR